MEARGVPASFGIRAGIIQEILVGLAGPLGKQREE